VSINSINSCFTRKSIAVDIDCRFGVATPIFPPATVALLLQSVGSASLCPGVVTLNTLIEVGKYNKSGVRILNLGKI
jgi:hypothetical protein